MRSLELERVESLKKYDFLERTTLLLVVACRYKVRYRVKLKIRFACVKFDFRCEILKI